MRPFLERGASPLRVRLGTNGFGVRMPGDVGGREMGAELIEWAPLLWVWDADLGCTGASGECVLVKVIVTANGSPAKYDD